MTLAAGTNGQADDALSYVACWAHVFRLPTLIVARDQTVLWKNAAADSYLRSSRLLALNDPVLMCKDKAQSEPLASFIAAAHAQPKIFFARDGEGQHLLIRAETIKPGRQAPANVLLLYSVPGREAFVWADLQQVFGLTPAEIGVVTRTMSGERADVIARELKVTMDTVRTHLRRSYSKLSVNSREQMFSLLNDYRVR